MDKQGTRSLETDQTYNNPSVPDWSVLLPNAKAVPVTFRRGVRWFLDWFTRLELEHSEDDMDSQSSDSESESDYG